MIHLRHPNQAYPARGSRQSFSLLRKPKSMRQVGSPSRYSTTRHASSQIAWLEWVSRAAGRIAIRNLAVGSDGKLQRCTYPSLLLFVGTFDFSPRTALQFAEDDLKQHRNNDARSPLLRQRRRAHRKHATPSIVAWPNSDQAFSCGNLWNRFARVYCWTYVSHSLPLSTFFLFSMDAIAFF